MNENLYLSNPGFICAAGNSANPAQFVENLASGNRNGIKKIDCSLVGENGVKSFYVGKIEDSKLKATGDKFEMRVLQILDFALSGIAGTVENAISRYGAARIRIAVKAGDNNEVCIGCFLRLHDRTAAGKQRRQLLL